MGSGVRTAGSSGPKRLTPGHYHTQRGGARPRVGFYLRALAYLRAGSAGAVAVVSVVLPMGRRPPGPSDSHSAFFSFSLAPILFFFSLTQKVTGAFVIRRHESLCAPHYLRLPPHLSLLYPRQRVHVRALYGPPLAARGHFNGIVLPSASQTQVGKYHPGNK